MGVPKPFVLIDKGPKRDIEVYFGAMMKRLIGQMHGDNTFKDRLPPNVQVRISREPA